MAASTPRTTSTARSLLALIACVLATAEVAAAAPPNDTCAGATVITPTVELSETVDTTSATTDLDDPLQSCTVGGAARNSRSIWYELTPPVDGVLSVYTLNGAFPADPPTIVSVHAGACGTLSEVACDDHDNGLASYLHTDVTAGVTYRIAITNETGSLGGDVKVRIYFEPNSPLCPHDAGDFAPKSSVTFALQQSRLDVNARATLESPLGDVAASGVQLLLENPDAAYAPVVAWTTTSIAIPAGAVGTGCGPKDGWTASANGMSHRYRNLSNALPPACTAGSANGLSDLRLKRDRTNPYAIAIKIRTRATTFTGVLADLTSVRLSLTLAATLDADNRARCASSYFPLPCQSKGGGAKIVCK